MNDNDMLSVSMLSVYAFSIYILPKEKLILLENNIYMFPTHKFYHVHLALPYVGLYKFAWASIQALGIVTLDLGFVVEDKSTELSTI